MDSSNRQLDMPEAPWKGEQANTRTSGGKGKMPENASSDIVRVPMVILESMNYKPGNFRRLSELLVERVPKSDAPHQWQLCDDFESSLLLVLFPSVHQDSERYDAAERAFKDVTGAEPRLRLQTWHLERWWLDGHAKPPAKGDRVSRAVHGNAQAARDAKEEVQAA